MGNKKIHPSLPLLLTFIFISSNINFLHGNDLELLLSFKSAINDPSHTLSSWSTKYPKYPSPPHHFCSWNGVVCNNISHVVSLNLSGKNISGELSSALFKLPFLQTVNLSDNRLSGNIPRDIFLNPSFRLLRHLNLSNNNFSGPIPHDNVINVQNLETLDLSNNILSGKIPSEIGSFLSLKFLDLGGNDLTGEIPISLTNLTRLEVFTLASNQLTGGIPLGIHRMTSLTWIYFGYNNLTGVIPREIGELSYLNHLDLVYNNLTGQIPDSIGKLTELRYLFLYQNRLSGTIPRSIFGLKKLVSLDLSDNNLSGEIPEIISELKNLEILHLFSNGFSGRIPESLSLLSRLQVLQLWSNKFYGKIPENLGRENNLEVLDLSTNNLTGRIPESVCDSGKLSKLILFSNFLEGDLPARLGACKSLKRVRLQNNRLSGEIPAGFTEMPLVYFLDTSNNNLEGNLDKFDWVMPELQMLSLSKNKFSGGLPESFGSKKLENLDLSVNKFNGVIPRAIGEFSELTNLNLHENRLTGKIPQEMCSCKKLVSLDLSNNFLTGEIPIGFSEFPVLGNLDLSVNELTGEIPKDLGKIQSLVQVNVSYNRLQGGLPQTGAFLAANATAVAGNNLCGRVFGNNLPPCKRVNKKIINNLWLVALISCAIFALIAFAGFIFHFMVRRRNKFSEIVTVENEFGTWEFQKTAFARELTVTDVLASIKEENAISRSKNRVLYKGKSVKGRKDMSEIDNMEFVIKESDHQDFSREILRRFSRHPNVVTLLATCRSEKVSYLVFEYVEGKRLSKTLSELSWERRKRVAVGIGKAIEFLHRRSFIAGEISPERMIVDLKGEARLILDHPYVVCLGSKSSNPSAYVATRESKETTEKSDIYSFGIFLIGLLTGKFSGDTELGALDNNNSLVEWGRYCLSDCHVDTWIDPTVRKSPEYRQNEIVETMNLALHCTGTDPRSRPCAKDTIKTLKSIFGTSSCI